MISSPFSSSFFVNSEPIKQNLNGIFANTHIKIQYWPRNYNELWEIMNILISVFHPFASICLYSVKFETIQFISIQIWLVWWMTNRYLVPLEYLVYLDSNLNFKFEGKIKFIAVSYKDIRLWWTICYSQIDILRQCVSI
jgi:hypothetical protein